MRRTLASLALFVCALQAWGAQQATTDISRVKLPVEFEANQGQHDRSVRFLSRAGAYQVGLTTSGAIFALPGRKPSSPRTMVTLQFNGAKGALQPVGERQTEHKSNYLFGESTERQYTDIPNFERVVYRAVYPGVDAVFYGRNGEIEYDFVLQPGADPKRIELAFAGARKIELDAQGDLLVHTTGGVLRQHKPVVYQERDGKREVVASKYRLLRGNKVRFDIAAYDAKYALTVDPILSYSTYLGGALSGAGLQSAAAELANHHRRVFRVAERPDQLADERVHGQQLQPGFLRLLRA